LPPPVAEGPICTKRLPPTLHEHAKGSTEITPDGRVVLILQRKQKKLEIDGDRVRMSSL